MLQFQFHLTTLSKLQGEEEQQASRHSHSKKRRSGWKLSNVMILVQCPLKVSLAYGRLGVNLVCAVSFAGGRSGSRRKIFTGRGKKVLNMRQENPRDCVRCAQSECQNVNGRCAMAETVGHEHHCVLGRQRTVTNCSCKWKRPNDIIRQHLTELDFNKVMTWSYTVENQEEMRLRINNKSLSQSKNNERYNRRYQLMISRY